MCKYKNAVQRYRRETNIETNIQRIKSGKIKNINKIYYETNKAEIWQTKKIYREISEKFKEYQRNYNEVNKEEIRRKGRECYHRSKNKNNDNDI